MAILCARCWPLRPNGSMEAEVEARTGAAKGARSPLREVQAQRIPRP